MDTQFGILAVAVEAPVRTDPGKVVFFTPGGTRLGTIEVGALPDMLTFSPNGRFLLVANEGEPGAVDPMGSVSIIDFHEWPRRVSVATVDFSSFDGATLDPSIVIAAGKAPSIDLEPEYITVSEDSRRAWVTLQDANAIAEIDVDRGKVTALRGLGFKDHGAAGNALDASDRDNAINLCTWPGLYGMYQPDALASFSHRGRTYLVSANEGDSRAADEARVSALTLGPAFDPIARQNQNLGRLTVNRTLGMTGGIYDRLFVYGARSFSIWSSREIRSSTPATSWSGSRRRFPAGRPRLRRSCSSRRSRRLPRQPARAPLPPRRCLRSPRPSTPTTRKATRSTLGATTRGPSRKASWSASCSDATTRSSVSSA